MKNNIGIKLNDPSMNNAESDNKLVTKSINYAYIIIKVIIIIIIIIVVTVNLTNKNSLEKSTTNTVNEIIRANP